MRFVLLLLVVAGCFGQGARESATVGADDDSDGDPFRNSCSVDADCVPAAATCCECPTFSTNTTDPNVGSCDQVECPPNACPDNVEAACRDVDGGQCVLQCKPLACQVDCEFGFAMDPNGCLSCTCAGPATDLSACLVDTDCVRTREDCCGCARGGDDTAVSVDDAARFDAALMCPTEPLCPDPQTTSCATDAPRCVQGSCELLADKPADACGSSDLGLCPPGQVCTVNASDQANLYGLGVCRPL